MLGLLWLVLVAAPPWFVHDRSLEGLKAQNEVRTTLLQGLGGVVLLVGAYFTYRQVLNSREQLAHSREQLEQARQQAQRSDERAREQLELAREQAQRSDERLREQLQIAQQGQMTERFTRAIDQLGHAQLDVRIGGIYALERIARDSSADRATIGEVLTAFVRSHAPWPPRLPGQYVATALIHQVPELQVRAADVQACLTVLGRGGFAPAAGGQGDRLDLHAVDMRHANLPDAHLERAYLFDAHLEAADLYGAHLGDANLFNAHLEDANLNDAHLEDAYLEDAHLEEAHLEHAHLERAVLFDAHLEEADLVNAHLERAALFDAHLEGANLESAQLEGANLRSAHLEGAVADSHTVWPAGFDWRAAGVITREDDVTPG